MIYIYTYLSAQTFSHSPSYSYVLSRRLGSLLQRDSSSASVLRSLLALACDFTSGGSSDALCLSGQDAARASLAGSIATCLEKVGTNSTVAL